MARSAGIIIIGDEILSGKFAEQNAQFLIAELRDLGVPLHRIEFIRDIEADIVDSIQRVAEACDWVFTSGGIGPTHDDVTISAVAAAFNDDVVSDPELETLLRSHYGQALTPGQLRLAQVPHGTRLLFGDDPRWPVLLYRNIHLLPGVPALFRRCFRSIRPRFQGSPLALARVYSRLEETELAAILDAAVADYSKVRFGSYPRLDEPDYRVIITVEAETAADANTAARALATALGPNLVRSELADGD